MTEAQIHVVPENDRWKVEWSGRWSSEHQTQDDAIKAADAEADKARPATVIIHGPDGRIEQQTDYSSEAPPPSA